MEHAARTRFVIEPEGLIDAYDEYGFGTDRTGGELLAAFVQRAVAAGGEALTFLRSLPRAPYRAGNDWTLSPTDSGFRLVRYEPVGDDYDAVTDEGTLRPIVDLTLDRRGRTVRKVTTWYDDLGYACEQVIVAGGKVSHRHRPTAHSAHASRTGLRPR